jgi:capsular exopolysaccharide synthesis family protein
MNTPQDLLPSPGFAPYRTLGAPPPEKELTIKDLWGIFHRRKGIILSTLLLCVGAAAVFCVVSTRRYEAKGELQVQKDASDALGLEGMMGAAGGGAGDALDGNITIQTQAQMLQSDTLALKVIKDLNLEQNADFRPKFSLIGWAMDLISPASASDAKGAELEDAPTKRTHVLKVFAANLQVKPVSGTRLIDISYLNPDPKVAAAVVNHLVQGLADFNFQTRYNATEQAASWLNGQLTDLRKQSEDLQAKVVQLQRDSGVFTLGETDTQGREQVYTPVLDRLQQATAQVGLAQSSRIMKGALYEVVKNGDPELISGLAGSGMLASASAGMSTSLTLIQTLRAQEATAQAQLNELSAKFGPAYPKLNELQASLDGIQKSIHAESTRIAERAKNDYTIAQQFEDSARTVFLNEKTQANTLNDKAISYMIVRQEAEESRALYESLLKKLKEAGVLAGLQSSNITIVDPGRVPSKPAKPNTLLYLAAALAGGLFIGSCGALLRDATDNKIQNLSELEEHLGETPLGVLPFHKEARQLKEGWTKGLLNAASSMAPGIPRGNASSSCGITVVNEPRAAYAEAVRALRTGLMLTRGGSPPKVILVTSSVPGEGKSMLSLNLAAVLAQQQGRRVLLVDADLRRPILGARLNLKTESGLSSILAAENIEQAALSAPRPFESLPGLDVLPAGPIPPYPAELLGSPQMAEAMRLWRETYDFIVIDGAPVLPVTDSVLLSNLADFTLVVARYKVTERQSLERSCRMLQAQGRHKMGVVLNAVERSAETYYNYYGYKNSAYYGSQQDVKNAA